MVSPPPNARELRHRLLDWYGATGRDLPWRRTRDPYGVLVSELMLQQTQAARVVDAWPAFLARFPTVGALADAPTSEVVGAWRGLGYNRRAINLQRAARAIVERHGGEVPLAVADLEALPGIGPYTARAVAVFAFGASAAPVDVNVARVLSRAVAGRPLTRSEAQALADAMAALPAESAAPSGAPGAAASDDQGPGAGGSGAATGSEAVGADAATGSAAVGADAATGGESREGAQAADGKRDHVRDGKGSSDPVVWSHALMDLGARRCTARVPHCEHCPIAAHCAWHRAGRPAPDPAAAGEVRARPQGRFEGSDRYHRGRLVDALRVARLDPAGLADAAELDGDPDRLERIVVGLVRDGLAEWRQGQLGLPGHRA